MNKLSIFWGDKSSDSFYWHMQASANSQSLKAIHPLESQQLLKADLNSAWEIIERCGMKLYAVDYLIIHGRYSLATADFDTALNHYEEAKQLIQETGYHLRDAELDLFAAQICQHTKQDLNTKGANYYLQKAKNRIEEIGQWGLMPKWEKIANTK